VVLGSDVAGGYELGTQGAMRMSVAVSHLGEGLLKRETETQGDPAPRNARIDWKESLYLATKRGQKRWVFLRDLDSSTSGHHLTLSRVRQSFIAIHQSF